MGDLDAIAVAWLTAGRWRTIQTGYADLVVAGIAEPSRGGLRRTGVAPRDGHPVRRALYGALSATRFPKEAAAQWAVDRALGGLKVELRRAGLLRPGWRRVLLPSLYLLVPSWLLVRMGAGHVRPALALVVLGAVLALVCLPRRTMRAEVLLARMRRERSADEHVAMAVAWDGGRALRERLPEVAETSGLLASSKGGRHHDSASLSFTHGSDL
ncbi:hypothetical protein [Longispora urticae]